MRQGALLADDLRKMLEVDYEDKEIGEAIFEIPGIKTPGPDGYGAVFFHDNWDIVGKEVMEAVLSIYPNF